MAYCECHNQRVSVHQQRKSFQSFPWIHHSATTRCPNGERNLNQDSQDHHQRPESCFLASEKVVSLPEKCPAGPNSQKIYVISVHSTRDFTAKVQKSTEAGKSCYLRATCQVKFHPIWTMPSHVPLSPFESPHLGLGGEVHQSNTSASCQWIPNPLVTNSCTMLPASWRVVFLWLLGSHVIDLRCCQHGEPARVTVECIGSVLCGPNYCIGGYRKNGSRWDFTQTIV